MTSKNACSTNKAALFRPKTWVFALSGVGFLFTIILPVLMGLQNMQDATPEDFARAFYNVSAFVTTENLFAKTAFVLLAVVCGMVAFRYLHDRQQVDFYHSLPISRTRLFFSRALSYTLPVLAVYLVALGLSLACIAAAGYGSHLNMLAILNGVLINFVLFLLLFALTAFSCILCGHTVIAILFHLWVLFFPIAAWQLAMGLGELFYPSFAMFGDEMALYLTPAVYYFLFAGQTNQPFIVAAYAVAAVVVTALSLLLFHRRKSEKSSCALAFAKSELPIELVMSATIGVVGAILLYAIGNDMLWFWVGLVLGTALMHGIVQIIYRFDFHAVTKRPIPLVALLVVLGAGLSMVRADVFGYESWRPRAEQVESINWDGMLIDQPEDIATAVEMINEKDRADEVRELYWRGEYQGDLYTNTILVSVKLKNGQTKKRNMPILVDAENRARCLTIARNTEFIKQNSPLFANERIEDVTSGAETVKCRISVDTGSVSRMLSQDAAVAAQYIAAMRKDVLARQEYSVPLAEIVLELYSPDPDGGRTYDAAGYVDFKVTAEDKRTLALLKEQAGLDLAKPIAAEEVEKMWFTIEVPESEDDGQQDAAVEAVPADTKYAQENEIKECVVTDPADIQTILDTGMINDENMYFWDDVIRLDNTYGEVEPTILYLQSKADNTRKTVYFKKGALPVEILKKYGYTE